MKNNDFSKRVRSLLREDERKRFDYLQATIAKEPEENKQLMTRMYYREQGLRLLVSN